jgi:hypothetical protein
VFCLVWRSGYDLTIYVSSFRREVSCVEGFVNGFTLDRVLALLGVLSVAFITKYQATG